MAKKQQEKRMISSEITELVNEPFSEYIKNDHFLSVSTAKKYKRSPLHKKYMIDKETQAKDIGRAAHAFVLEPQTFKRDYVLIDEREIIATLSQSYSNPKATKLYKEWYVQAVGGNLDKEPILYETAEMLKDMKTALFKHPFIKYLITTSQLEISAYGIIDGVFCKGRYDIFKPEKRWVADLKFVLDSSYKGFQNYLTGFDGHLQPAQYLRLAENYVGDGMPWKFFWIAQEKFPPYAVSIYKASAQVMAVGEHELGLLIQEHKYCEETQNYEGYETFCDNEFGIRDIDLPGYAIKDYNFYHHKSKK